MVAIAASKVTRPIDRLCCALGILLCLWFGSATLFSATQIELGFDPAYHATVAKNFATEQGWASSYERRFPVNPDVTTGPSMLLPTAGLIRIFGPERWLPGVSAALLQLTVLTLIFWQLAGLYQRRPVYWALLACLCGVFTLHAHTWWVTLTADFLVFLLWWLAAILLVRPPDGGGLGHGVLVGLVVAAALLAKALAWFGIAVLLLYGLRQGWLLRQPRAWLRQSAGILLGAGLLLLPWQLFVHAQIAELTPAQQQERATYAAAFFSEQGSGLSEWAGSADRIGLLAENLARNGGLLREHMQVRYGIGPVVLGGLLLAMLAQTLWWLVRARDPLQRMLLLLGLMGSVQLGWFLLLSVSWNAKYALAPLCIAMIMPLLSLARHLNPAPLLPMLCLLPLLFPAPSQAYLQRLLSYDASPNAYTRDQLSTLNYLRGLDASLPLAGCGWVFAPWDMEYLWPGSGHFRDCRRLIADGLEIASDGTARWRDEVAFVLVLNHVFWEFSDYRQWYQPVWRACSQELLHRTEYFSVAACRPQALQRHIPLQAGSIFRPEANRSTFIHKPLPLQ